MLPTVVQTQVCHLQQGLMGVVVDGAAVMKTSVFVSQEDRCLFWTHRSSSLSPPTPSPQPAALSPASPPRASPPRASPSSCSSAVSHQLLPPVDHRHR